MTRAPAPSLGLVVAVAGLATLGAEIATARLLAPAFGSSTVIWANTIAIVLVALAIGSWVGGRLADIGPTPVRMHRILLVGAALLAIAPIIATPLLSVGVEALDDIDAPGFFGSMVAILILVATPLALLGAVTPYAVRIALDAVEGGSQAAVRQAGRTAGRLSALATAGSLLGTFLAALLLIPAIGTRRTFLLFALLLAVTALWGLATTSDRVDPASRHDDGMRPGEGESRRSPKLVAAALVPAVIALVLVAPVPTVKAASGDQRLLEERETSEQYARVLQAPDGTRTMELGEGQAIHSRLRPGTTLGGLYWDEMQALTYLAPGGPRRILILGNAGGTIATAARALDSRVSVDAVDYDEDLTQLGQRWFRLGAPRLTYEATPRGFPSVRPMAAGARLDLRTADARVALRRSEGGYDAIIVDAYRQPYIPFHLTTREFFSLARERLAPGGVVLVNVGHPSGDDELERILSASMRAGGLTSVLRDPAQRLNTQIAASASPLQPGRLSSVASSWFAPACMTRAATAEAGELFDDACTFSSVMRATAARLQPGLTGADPWTDDRAPVEMLIDGSLAKVATGAGS